MLKEYSSGSVGRVADFDNIWRYVEILTEKFFAHLN